MKVWPTNLLPQTPAAKANTLIEWMKAGLINAEQALAMTDHPDTESLVGDYVAKRENIEKKITMLMAGGSFEKCQPHPYMDLDMSMTIAANRLNKFESKGYDDAALEKLRKWYEAAAKLKADKMAKNAAMVAPAAPGAPPPPPGGMPPPTPPPVGPQAPPMAA